MKQLIIVSSMLLLCACNDQSITVPLPPDEGVTSNVAHNGLSVVDFTINRTSEQDGTNLIPESSTELIIENKSGQEVYDLNYSFLVFDEKAGFENLMEVRSGQVSSLAIGEIVTEPLDENWNPTLSTMEFDWVIETSELSHTLVGIYSGIFNLVDRYDTSGVFDSTAAIKSVTSCLVEVHSDGSVRFLLADGIMTKLMEGNILDDGTFVGQAKGSPGNVLSMISSRVDFNLDSTMLEGTLKFESDVEVARYAEVEVELF